MSLTSTQAEETDLLTILSEMFGNNNAPMLAEYLDQVANRHLTVLKAARYLQYGGKNGQSLYTHILDGILLLDQLCGLFALPDHEARVLFTAYTVHDINKILDNSAGLSKDATPDKIANQIVVYGLDQFFPHYAQYLYDITTLARKHPGHTQVSGESFVRTNTARYGLGLDRVEQLAVLIQALDVIDLSHTLDEASHKETFLSHLNQFALSEGSQYVFFTHQIDESRGALTNVLHNAVSAYFNEQYGLIPLLLYPDGIAYLAKRGDEPGITNVDIEAIAVRTVGELVRMTGASFTDFIEVRPLGIKVDAKCLELGRPFDDILGAIASIVQRRSFKRDELAHKARERARINLAKNSALYPDAVQPLEALLAGDVIARSDEQLRVGELMRSYYIFLDTHFAKAAPNPWERIYNLLDLPVEQRSLLAFFDARMDRAYVLARELNLTWDIVYARLLTDGRTLLVARTSSDPGASLFSTYLERHARFGTQARSVDFTAGLRQYAANQHKQCVQCGDPFPTTPWMAADVRSDIAVQTFSNRLRGGPGEPKKNVCGVCQTQFLIERLSYPEIRGEHTLYLHLFPYTYLTQPFVQALQQTFRHLQTGDLRALWLNGDRAMQEYSDRAIVRAPMRTRTNQNKSHTYGIYLPSHADALIGNLLILPLNPAGDTDTERFLFALEYAMILQRYFGCRAVLSGSSVVPFDQHQIGDLTTDVTPLSCRGLVDASVYRQFEPNTSHTANLPVLWQQMIALYTIKRHIGGQDDPLPALVEALAFHPLGIFYTTEKLIERRVRDDRKSRNTDWLLINIAQELVVPVAQLAHIKGGDWVDKLSTHLQRLAHIAWENRLIGKTFAKHSLMTAMDEVFRKIGLQSKAAEGDVDFLKAVTAQDIFDYLDRIADQRYKPGARKREAIKEFVDTFYTGIYTGVYNNSTARLLGDEKLLRSAYLFYIREQIPRKLTESVEKGDVDDLSIVEA